MSLLMFVHDEDSFLVMTDTLATSFEGEPSLLQDKLYVLPHLQMLVGGTGFAPFVEAWQRKIQHGLLALDIHMVDLHAPSMMREIYAELEAAHGPLPGTSTIYHFGIAKETGAFVRYTYRSADGFASEYEDRVPGFGVKPVPASGELPSCESLDDLIDLAKALRAEQDAAPRENRVYIGGELVVTTMTRAGISIAVVYRFDDYEDAWQRMNELLPGATG